jgi:putative DNA methylase
MGAQLMAIVADGPGGRLCLAPNAEQEATAAQAAPLNPPQTLLPDKALGFRVQQYGMTRHSDLFTPRQLVALTTFSDLIAEARERVLAEARAAWSELDPASAGDERPLREGGNGPVAYADALATYLALAIDRCADYWSTLCSWNLTGENLSHTFTRQALPMIWDFAEANPFSASSGNFMGAIDWVAAVVEAVPCSARGVARQCEASAAVNGVARPLISTDPPYYDNVGYADLSDFFYVWLRRNLAPIYPDLFATLLTPKGGELIASPYRHGGDKDQARRFFEDGLRRVFANLRAAQHPDYPLTLYYAFKQAEVEQAGDEAPDEELEEAAEPLADDEAETAEERQAPARSRNGQNGTALVASTGWETMLEGLISAGFTITGTWPIHTERFNRSRAIESNALASSIVLVCRPRLENAPIASRQQFMRELRQELPQAIHHLQQGGIAPVDLAQASIGPGMAIYSPTAASKTSMAAPSACAPPSNSSTASWTKS